MVVLGTTGASATVVLNENFDGYTNGTLSGQGGWTATAAAATPMQVAGAADKFVQLGTSGQDEYKALSTALPHFDGNVIHTSLAVNVSAAQAAGDYFAHVSDPVATTTNFYQRLFARSSGAGYQIGLVDTSGTGSTITYGTTVLNFNQEYDVDINWTVVPGLINDTFALTVDSSPYLNHIWTSTSVAEPGNISAANLRQGAAANAATVQVDDYLVEGQIPEPASLGLLATVAVLSLRRRK